MFTQEPPGSIQSWKGLHGPFSVTKDAALHSKQNCPTVGSSGCPLYYKIISVHNLVSVTVFDGADDLLEESSGFILSHLSILYNIIEEFATSVFENHDNFKRCFDYGVSIRMPLECSYELY